jgi:hypothetical protein
MGLMRLIAGVTGLAQTWWQSTLAVLGGLGCLAVAWTVVTSTDPDKHPEVTRTS